MSYAFSTGLKAAVTEVLGLIPGPTLVLNAIRKAYKTARMSYKLVNRGVQLRRRLVRVYMLWKMRRKMTNKAKLRAANASRELMHLAKSSTQSALTVLRIPTHRHMDAVQT